MLNQQKQREKRIVSFLVTGSVLVIQYIVYILCILCLCCAILLRLLLASTARLGLLPKIANDGDDIRFASEAALGPEMRIQYNKNY